jgi:superfamily II DNA or RNA helicase
VAERLEDAGYTVEFEGELGLVQGGVFNWARPLTLALVTTLWRRIEDGSIPEEFFRYFGQVIYDEVHQIGAPKFSLTASPFYGDRIGLTATVEREDGLDPIYRYHIGDPFYSDLSQEIIPDIYFQQTSLFATLIMLALLAGGIGVVRRSLRPQ